MPQSDVADVSDGLVDRNTSRVGPMLPTGVDLGPTDKKRGIEAR